MDFLIFLNNPSSLLVWSDNGLTLILPLLEKMTLQEVFLLRVGITPTLFPAIFWTQTRACAQTPIFAQATTPAPNPPNMYINIDLQKISNLAFKTIVKHQKHGKTNFAFQNQALKARNYNLYYGSSYMECYNF